MPTLADTDQIILGIETSCDDTSLALISIKDGQHHLIDILSFSQEEILSAWGGVVPEIAARNHHEKLLPLLTVLLSKNNLTPSDLSAIAITCAPGLLGPLLTGLNFAKGLSLLFKLPLIPINHLLAHLEVINLGRPQEKIVPYPYLGLLLSGGHSMFVLMKSLDDFDILGSTIDDAAGEAFDKGGKLLGIGYPGGALIDKMAATGDAHKYQFPIGLHHDPKPNFSFSGLKTSLRVFLEKNKKNNEEVEFNMNDVCASYQHAIVEAVAIKLNLAYKLAGIQNLPIVVGGGVACNSGIRKRLTQIWGEKIHFVPPQFCTDNGAMIAFLASLHFKNKTATVKKYPDCLKLGVSSRVFEKSQFENRKAGISS